MSENEKWSWISVEGRFNGSRPSIPQVSGVHQDEEGVLTFRINDPVNLDAWLQISIHPRSDQ